MSGAVNGRVSPGARNPVAGMELRFPLPPGEQERLREAFNARLAALREPVTDPDMSLILWTVYRAGWWDSHLDALAVRAAEARREMGEDATTLDVARIEVAGGRQEVR